MPDFSMDMYKRCIEWINDKKEKHYSWDAIKRCCAEQDKIVEAFEKLKIPDMIVPMEMSYEEWVALVDDRMHNFIEILPNQTNGIYSHEGPVEYPVPNGNHDGWREYVKLLNGEIDGKRKMSKDSIDKLEESCHWVLNRIRKDTRDKGPQKGLVMGSVQSGKTSAMVGLITMAAHYDWNFIIVLSGSIENLREQTRDRFRRDIRRCQDADWHFLESSTNENFLKDISEGKTISLREANFNFSEPQTFTKSRYHETYVMVCLKQASRLSKLITWLHSDRNVSSKLRLIIIDDEADQASINTANMTTAEIINRTKINQLIINLANGVDENEEKLNFQALNYISFTATPYANVLNEAYRDSLYPKDFVMCLPENNSYFGGKVIWGSKYDENYSGLDIVRIINKTSETTVKAIAKGNYAPFPDEFKNSVAWFICCVAALRYKNWKKPVSMLIHTSTGTRAHFYIYDALRQWIELDRDNGKLLDRCRVVYDSEIKKLSFDIFKESYSEYENIDDMDKNYPAFDALIPLINEILKENTKSIEIATSGDEQFKYSATGIHVCVDNCKARKYADDSETQLRIVYPNEKQLETMEKAPAFIVIGGNTLSRGLTIEGLVSTFFMRTTNQADTLMQMARWYGYRKGYELYPRIWMTQENINKYRLLQQVDEKLRKTLNEYKVMGKDPGKIYPSIMSTSAISKFNLTAKNKSQHMIPCSMDFSGDSYEATEFYQDEEKLKANLKLTNTFIRKLGNPQKSDVFPERSHVWKNVSSQEAIRYLKEFAIYSPSNFNDQMRDFYAWMEQENENGKYLKWNVAVCGASTYKGEKWSIDGVDALMGKVERTRIGGVSEHIDIGSMRSNKDGVCDIDVHECKDMSTLEKGKTGKDIEIVRGKLGYSDIPLLLIYCICKEGGKETETRKKLGIQTDLIGYGIIIGGELSSTDHVESVVVSAPEEEEDEVDE